MIRMAYLDDNDLYEKIKDAYVELMNTKTLRKHWREVRNDCVELAGFNYSIKQLVSAPFGELVVIAKAFDDALAGATDERRKEIKDRLQNEVFKYDRYWSGCYFVGDDETLDEYAIRCCDHVVSVFEDVARTEKFWDDLDN